MQRGFVSPELAGQLAEFRSSPRPRPARATRSSRASSSSPPTGCASWRAPARAARGVPAEALAEIVLFCAVPNLVFDPTGTTQMVDQAVAGVDPSAGRVLKGEKIIGAHERITGETAARAPLVRVLAARARRIGEAFWRCCRRCSGRLLVLLLALGLFVAYVRLNRPELLEHPGDFWLLALLESLVLVSAAVLVRALQPAPDPGAGGRR